MELDISYQLTQDEVEQGLKLFQKLLHGRRIMVETILLAAMAVFFIVSFILQAQWFNIAMCCLCLAVIAALQLVPRLELKQLEKQYNRDIRLQLLPEARELQVLIEGRVVDISIDQSTKIRQVSDIMVMAPENGGLLIIPKRAVDSEVLLKVIKEVEDE